MDLSSLSDADLMALKGGDLSKLSDVGLMQLKGGGAAPTTKAPQAKPEAPSVLRMLKDEALTSIPGGFARGVKDVIDTGAEYLAKVASPQESTRVRALNEAGKQEFTQAQERTGAGGSDVARVGGNIVTTLPVGGALANLLSKIPGVATKAPAVLDAIRTSGMTAGGMTGAKSLVPRMIGGGVTGGAATFAVSPDDAGAGVAVGTALPGVMAVAGKVGQTVGPVLFKKSANRAAVEKVADALGDKSPQAVWDMQTYGPKGAKNIPLSAAGITGDMNVAQLEQVSRMRNPTQWTDFDQRQGTAVFENVMDATKEAGELAARAQLRRDNWTEAWEKASAAQKPRVWNRRMGQLGGDIGQALASPQASNPAVRGLLEAVRDEVLRVGPGFSPGHLQQIRANLQGKANPMSTDVFKSAPRDAPAVRDLIKEMDDILNVSTGGKWQKVIKGYAQDSASLHQSKAAQKIRNAYLDDATGRVRGGATVDVEGDIPRITQAGLNRAMDAARLPDKTLALSPQANQQLMATLDTLRRQGVVQNLKRSATAGGGSDTMANAMAVGSTASGVPSWLLQALNVGRKVATGRTDQELAQLLSDPNSLAAALAQFSTPSRPGPLALTASRSLPILTGQGEGP